jgi:gamma-glutamyltranspeptidase/glutathione hydrolase/leukotriene-C4 hydrolase
MNGSAVDAAIAAGLCNGLMNSQSAGIGGGHFMVIYLKEKGKAYAINARESAPDSAYETMFQNRSSSTGGLATGIPGEIAGYWEAWTLGGRLPWSTLFQPAIDMCRNGYRVPASLARAIASNENLIRSNQQLANIFINNKTQLPYKVNETIYRPLLGNTLELIARENISAFYLGFSNLTQYMVEEINENGGNVTVEDFNGYHALPTQAVSVPLTPSLTLYTTPVPSSGLLVSFIMRLMAEYNLNETVLANTNSQSLFYNRLVESFKFAFASRAQLGDECTKLVNEVVFNLTSQAFIDKIRSRIVDYRTFPGSYYSNFTFRQDEGTAHISVLANGDAVSFTSSVNTYFGAGYAGRRTGIIYNSQMNDFSSSPSADGSSKQLSGANLIKARKRPMSSMSPIIVVNGAGDVSLVLGASGGPHIVSAVAQVAIKILSLGKNLKDAIDDRRLHHQLYPENLQAEINFDSSLLNIFKQFGYKNISCFAYGGSAVQGIYSPQKNLIYSYSDPRKGGIPAGV